MPLFMDIHNLEDITLERLNESHVADCAVQAKYGVRYLKWWWNRETGKVFCLVEAPSAEAAAAVHREAHGFVADEIIQVESAVADAFLGGGGVSDFGAALLPGPESRLDGGFRAVLFTDMTGSTHLTNRLGDERALEILRSHNALIRTALADHAGREVKHTGDGIMAAFTSAARAVACSVAIQRAFAEHNRGSPDVEITVRIGASAGEPVEDDRDLFGAAVQLAARVCERARPEQILVANVVAELCVGKGFRFTDRGEALLKGFDLPVRLHEVVWA